MAARARRLPEVSWTYLRKAKGGGGCWFFVFFWFWGCFGVVFGFGVFFFVGFGWVGVVVFLGGLFGILWVCWFVCSVFGSFVLLDLSCFAMFLIA